MEGRRCKLGRVEGRATQLVAAAVPRTVAAVFADRDRVTGRPDAWAATFGGDQATSERRAALVGRLTTRGVQPAAYSVGLAVALGYAITISEFSEFRIKIESVNCGKPLAKSHRFKGGELTALRRWSTD